MLTGVLISVYPNLDLTLCTMVTTATSGNSGGGGSSAMIVVSLVIAQLSIMVLSRLKKLPFSCCPTSAAGLSCMKRRELLLHLCDVTSTLAFEAGLFGKDSPPLPPLIILARSWMEFLTKMIYPTSLSFFFH